MRIITMNDFLTNPTGKSSSSFARRDLIIANLYDRFDKLTSKAKISCNGYKSNGAYYFYLKIPSEKFLNKMHYDVVLEFIPIGNTDKNERTLNNYQMRMFSNSPNFMYTYAYVYNQDGNIVNFLKNKINKKALTKEPSIKNPQFIYGFEKSIFFALIHIKKLGLNYLNKTVSFSKLNKTILSSSIKSTTYIQDKYNDLLNKERLERKNAKSKNQAEKRTTKVSNLNTTRKRNKTLNGKTKSSTFKVKKSKKNLDTHKK